MPEPVRESDGMEGIPDSLAGLGRRLAERRKARGMSIADAAAATRIREPFLEAIESGQIDLLPGRAYARGFLRTYCLHLGEGALWSAYDRLLPADWDPASRGLGEYSPPVPVFRRSSRIWLYLVLVAAIVTAIYLVWQQRRELRETADQAPIAQTAPTLPIPKPSPGISSPPPSPPPISSSVPGTASGSVDLSWMDGRPSPTPSPAAAAASAEPAAVSEGTLELQGRRTVWIRVSQGKNTLYQGLLQKGESKAFPVSGEVRVRLGSMSGTALRFGNTLMDPVGPKGSPKTYWIYPGGLVSPSRVVPTRMP